MDDIARKLLDDLLATPGTSGYEEQVQQVVRDFLKPLADRIETDVHGNVIAYKNPEAPHRILIDAHCDQIGLVVSHVDDSGFLFFQTVGGWDPQQLVGQQVIVGSASEPIPGVISRKAIHLLEDSERNQVVKLPDLWIDIGASSGAEARERVRVGDPVTLRPGYVPLMNRRIAGPAMDDRVGLWVALESFRRCADVRPPCCIVVVSAVQEEIGLRGAKTAAYAVDPHVGIALEVTHATDCPSVDKRQQGDLRVGNGPVVFRGPNMNPKVFAALERSATLTNTRMQVAACGRAAPNDSNSIQVSRAGVATGLISIPNRYMHSGVELVSLDDLEGAATMLSHFLTTTPADADWTP
ncbi:MAG TPA: hydrolase [Planctomycetaceae bacterium]|nr:hydrolase [Planctomycetaceae bacterium]HRE99276.1 M42 family metallopeptidase [Pirellulaceae bacterium]